MTTDIYEAHSSLATTIRDDILYNGFLKAISEPRTVEHGCIVTRMSERAILHAVAISVTTYVPHPLATGAKAGDALNVKVLVSVTVRNLLAFSSHFS